MSTDRELLELAAKAAGIEGEWTNPMPSAVGNGTIRTGIGGSLWNPLTDDGDALRLACDLGLRVYPIARTELGAACSAVASVTGERLSDVSDVSQGTCAATRRAIVRAAAEIGWNMS